MTQKQRRKSSRTVFQIELARRLRGPQPHGVDNVVPVARDGGVVGQSQHHLPAEPHADQTPALTRLLLHAEVLKNPSLLYLSVHPFDTVGVMLSPAVELHGAHVLGASLLPGVAEAQPVVGLLNLHTATSIRIKGQREEAEFVGPSCSRAKHPSGDRKWHRLATIMGALVGAG